MTDLLFGVQIICTFWAGISQFWKMLTTTQGVSISWLVFWEAFLIINVVLAVKAHQNKPSRVTLQIVMSYVAWTIMITADLAILILKSVDGWDQKDTTTFILAGAGIIGTLLIGHWRYNLGLADPMVRGYLAVFFKAIPQLVLAYKISMEGGDGIAFGGVFAGHITILTRLGQLWFSIREAGWDRNRIGSAISEIANEASWVIVTIIWLL